MWGSDGELLVATNDGRLRVLDPGMATRWEYDMDAMEPDPRPSPAWARLPLDR